MATSINVLFVNQTGQMSGAERSLVELLRALPAEVSPVIACPPGDLADAACGMGMPVRDVPGTDLSFRPHPVYTTRGLAWIAGAARRIRLLSRELGIDLVHANTTRAGLAATLASRFGGPPTITHVRDWIPSGKGPAAVLATVARGSAATIANSRFTAAQLPPSVRDRVTVIHNPVDAERLNPAKIDRESARSSLGLSESDAVLAVIAQITPWKGQDDALRVVAHLLPDHPRIRLLVVGSAKFSAASTRFDNPGFERRLRDLSMELGIQDSVEFLGERDDVVVILRATDVLLVPSWQEAFGRSALEGLAMGIPVVATNVGGPTEIVRDGVDGVLLAPRDPEGWASAVGELLDDPGLRARMGASGRERACSEFAPSVHGELVRRIYEHVLSGSA